MHGDTLPSSIRIERLIFLLFKAIALVETFAEQRKAKLCMLLLEEAALLHALLRNVNTFMYTDDDFARPSDRTAATSSTDMAISVANSSGLDPPAFLRRKERDTDMQHIHQNTIKYNNKIIK